MMLMSSAVPAGDGSNLPPSPPWEGETRVYVGRLPDNVDRLELDSIFLRYGPIKKWTFGSKNFAFVEYHHHAAAAQAVRQGGDIYLRSNKYRHRLDVSWPSSSSFSENSISRSIGHDLPPTGNYSSRYDGRPRDYYGYRSQYDMERDRLYSDRNVRNGHEADYRRPYSPSEGRVDDSRSNHKRDHRGRRGDIAVSSPPSRSDKERKERSSSATSESELSSLRSITTSLSSRNLGYVPLSASSHIWRDDAGWDGIDPPYHRLREDEEYFFFALCFTDMSEHKTEEEFKKKLDALDCKKGSVSIQVQPRYSAAIVVYRNAIMASRALERLRGQNAFGEDTVIEFIYRKRGEVNSPSYYRQPKEEEKLPNYTGCRTIVITKLDVTDEEITDSTLRNIFGVYGRIQRIYRLSEHDSNKFKGCAFISYIRPEAAERAVKRMDGINLFLRKGSFIGVDYADCSDPPLDTDTGVCSKVGASSPSSYDSATSASTTPSLASDGSVDLSVGNSGSSSESMSSFDSATSTTLVVDMPTKPQPTQQTSLTKQDSSIAPTKLTNPASDSSKEKWAAMPLKHRILKSFGMPTKEDKPPASSSETSPPATASSSSTSSEIKNTTKKGLEEERIDKIEAGIARARERGQLKEEKNSKGSQRSSNTVAKRKVTQDRSASRKKHRGDSVDETASQFPKDREKEESMSKQVASAATSEDRWNQQVAEKDKELIRERMESIIRKYDGMKDKNTAVAYLLSVIRNSNRTKIEVGTAWRHPAEYADIYAELGMIKLPVVNGRYHMWQLPHEGTVQRAYLDSFKPRETKEKKKRGKTRQEEKLREAEEREREKERQREKATAVITSTQPALLPDRLPPNSTEGIELPTITPPPKKKRESAISVLKSLAESCQSRAAEEAQRPLSVSDPNPLVLKASPELTDEKPEPAVLSKPSNQSDMKQPKVLKGARNRRLKRPVDERSETRSNSNPIKPEAESADRELQRLIDDDMETAICVSTVVSETISRANNSLGVQPDPTVQAKNEEKDQARVSELAQGLSKSEPEPEQEMDSGSGAIVEVKTEHGVQEGTANNDADSKPEEEAKETQPSVFREDPEEDDEMSEDAVTMKDITKRKRRRTLDEESISSSASSRGPSRKRIPRVRSGGPSEEPELLRVLQREALGLRKRTATNSRSGQKISRLEEMRLRRRKRNKERLLREREEEQASKRERRKNRRAEQMSDEQIARPTRGNASSGEDEAEEKKKRARGRQRTSNSKKNVADETDEEEDEREKSDGEDMIGRVSLHSRRTNWRKEKPAGRATRRTRWRYAEKKIKKESDDEDEDDYESTQESSTSDEEEEYAASSPSDDEDDQFDDEDSEAEEDLTEDE